MSGGLDSSLVCGIISKIYKESKKGILNTFNWDEGSTDLEYSQKVADYIGSKHHQVVCSEEDFLNAILMLSVQQNLMIQLLLELALVII